MSLFSRMFSYFYNAPSKYVEADNSLRDCEVAEKTAEVVNPALSIVQDSQGILVSWRDNVAIILTHAITANTLKAYLYTGSYRVNSAYTAIPVQYRTHSQERETVGRLIELLTIDGIIQRNGSMIGLAGGVTLN